MGGGGGGGWYGYVTVGVTFRKWVQYSCIVYYDIVCQEQINTNGGK